MQLHTTTIGKIQRGISRGRRSQLFAPNDTDGTEAALLARCGNRRDVVGMGAPKGEEGCMRQSLGLHQVVFEFPELISGNERVDLVLASHHQRSVGRYEGTEVYLFIGDFGLDIKNRRCSHGTESRRKGRLFMLCEPGPSERLKKA